MSGWVELASIRVDSGGLTPNSIRVLPSSTTVPEKGRFRLRLLPVLSHSGHADAGLQTVPGTTQRHQQHLSRNSEPSGDMVLLLMDAETSGEAQSSHDRLEAAPPPPRADRRCSLTSSYLSSAPTLATVPKGCQFLPDI